MTNAGYILFWTMLSFSITQVTKIPVKPVALDYSEYWVSPRTTYEDFRLRVFNNGTEPVVIEKVVPSCGCILTTIQSNRATRERPGEIYVAIISQKVDSLQPITVDVYTSESNTTPKRVYIRRAPKTSLTR